MPRSRSTNILLLLMLLALVANVLVTLARPPAAYAVDKGQRKSGVAAEATAASDRVNLSSVLGGIAPAVRDMASSNREIANAIREHARATDRIARAVQASGKRRPPGQPRQ